jgi:hypothetical protein
MDLLAAWQRILFGTEHDSLLATQQYEDAMADELGHGHFSS